MKGAVKKIIIGGAILIGLGAVPVVPEDMDLLYSFQCPCEQTLIETATSTTEQLPLVVSQSDDAYAVFGDRNGNQVVVSVAKQTYEKMGKLNGYIHNPKKNDYVSLFQTAARDAHAAIARDSELYVQSVTATSLTFAFNNVAGNVLYVSGHDRSSGATQVTGVTYNASALTKIVELDGAAGQNDRAITTWRLRSPATGSNNVVVSSSASNNLRFSAVSYSGASTTASENGTDTSIGSGVTSISTDITPTLSGCWMAMFSKDNSGGVTYGNSTGDSIRVNTDGGGHVYVDTDGPIAGANTMTNTMSAQTLGALAWTICPSSVAAPTRSQPMLFFQ